MSATAGDTTVDALVLGGGLAGLSLALQLKQQDADLSVTVLERRTHPVPEGAFKVGESLVEIGADYFANVLGLREHLETQQIRKFGFRFFFSDGRGDIDHCTEIGVSKLLPTPSWQLDRGRFENFLGERARAAGVRFVDGAVVRGITMGQGDAPHAVEFEHDGAQQRITARWLVDASGRAGLLKRKLGLARDNAHDAQAVWWRVEGILDPNDWSGDAAWRGRCDPPDRWRSTNHMCGPGYWFWMIPLSSGAHSLGIVCDPALHPLESINSHDNAMAWLRVHQPGVARMLDDGKHALQDFHFLRHFSYGCKQVFSADRWALTGEAGLFLDPFYSPGSDFIAIANTYICALVATDRAGENFAPYADLYQQLYFSYYDNTLSLYQGQYPLFGDPAVMTAKVVWDYTYYWSLLAPLFYARRMTDTRMLGRLREHFVRGNRLNAAMQPLLRNWGARNAARGDDAQPTISHDGPCPPMLDQYTVDWFYRMNEGLQDRLDDDAFAARIADNLSRMQQLAAELLARARGAYPQIDDHGLAALFEDVDATEPLLPAYWYAAA